MKKEFKCFCGETTGELDISQESVECPSCKRTYGCVSNTKTEELIIFETGKSKNGRLSPKMPKGTKVKSQYHRYFRLHLHEIIKHSSAGEKYTHVGVNGKYRVKLDSSRMKTLTASTVCSCCGLKGQYWALESHKGVTPVNHHVNLYGINDDGNEVLMCGKKLSVGISNGTNRVTMCSTCITRRFPQNKGK